jgi:phosphatidylglycerophosphatase A
LQGLLAVVLLAFAAGVWFCDVTGKALGVSDHGGIVWDEIVAMWLILAFTPASGLWYGVAFLLFRLFDIWKPFPIRYFDQHVKGGFGVMLDDLLAAGYALAALKLLEHFYG